MHRASVDVFTIGVLSRNTFVLRKAGESPNDRNDRAIRKIVQFYNEHLKQQSKWDKWLLHTLHKRVRLIHCDDMHHFSLLVSIVLLTDDVANRDLARQEGLLAYSR